MVGSQSIGWTSGLSENIWSKAVLHENYPTKPERAVHKEAGQLAGVSGGYMSVTVYFLCRLATIDLLVTQFQHYKQNRTCFEYPPCWQQQFEVDKSRTATLT